MRVFICVSDRWENLDIIAEALDALPADTVILQAKPGNYDNSAVKLARRRGFVCEDFVPEGMDQQLYGRGTGQVLMWRAFDTKPDRVLAFRFKRSSGITSVIKEAERRGIPVEIFDNKGV